MQHSRNLSFVVFTVPEVHPVIGWGLPISRDLILKCYVEVLNTGRAITLSTSF
jgi:hypothetical protein